MVDESDRARVGQGSRATGTTASASLEAAFESALASARSRGHLIVTAEHLLVELLEEPSAQILLSGSNVDLTSLRAELTTYLDAEVETLTADAVPRADESLQNAMRRAVMKSFLSNKKGADGADIIVAVLVEGDTFAAKTLQGHGLTVETAESANIERYLTRSAEVSKRLDILRERIEEQKVGTDSGAALRSAGLQTPAKLSNDTGTEVGHKAYTLRVSGENDSDAPVQFKAAVSHDGFLNLYVEETPFETEFVAVTVVALFEAVDAGGRLEVELLTELEGEQRTVSGFTAASGAIFQDPRDHMGQQSGRLR